jgi:hypothetical protein
MNLANFLPVGLASLTVLAIALPNLKTQSPSTQPALAQSPTNQTSPATSPRRLTIKVSVAEPSDLKVKEGDRIKTGKLIADRSRERQRLTSQKQQFTLSLQKLQSFTPFPPTPPQPVPALKALPPMSYLEHEAEGERAKAAIASVESELETQKVNNALPKALRSEPHLYLMIARVK